MTAARLRLHNGRGELMVRFGLLLVALALAAGEATARAQTAMPCASPCPDGQTCLHGTCWMAAPQSSPPPRRRNRVFQLIPYLGLHSFWGQASPNVEPGLRVGGLVGFRLGDVVSINGELTIDRIGLHDLPAGEKYSELDFGAALSPLFTIVDGKFGLAVGPKLGVWVAEYHQSSLSRGDGAGTFSGFDFGANLTGVTPISRRLWLGGLASFDLRTYRRSCFTPWDGREGCSSSDLPSADKIVSLSILLMFSV